MRENFLHDMEPGRSSWTGAEVREKKLLQKGHDMLNARTKCASPIAPTHEPFSLAPSWTLLLDAVRCYRTHQLGCWGRPARLTTKLCLTLSPDGDNMPPTPIMRSAAALLGRATRIVVGLLKSRAQSEAEERDEHDHQMLMAISRCRLHGILERPDIHMRNGYLMCSNGDRSQTSDRTSRALQLPSD